MTLHADDSEDSSDSAFAAPPTTQHSIDIADCSDFAFAAKKYVASDGVTVPRR